MSFFVVFFLKKTQPEKGFLPSSKKSYCLNLLKNLRFNSNIYSITVGRRRLLTLVNCGSLNHSSNLRVQRFVQYNLLLNTITVRIGQNLLQRIVWIGSDFGRNNSGAWLEIVACCWDKLSLVLEVLV